MHKTILKRTTPCNQINSNGKIGQIYTNKGLEFIEEPIDKCIKYYYIPKI